MPKERGTQPVLDRCRLLHLAVSSDERGSLVAVESGTGLPFEIRRVYYIFGAKPGVARGHHAHVELTQWAICVSGACSITLDSGRQCTEVRLDHPNEALEIGPMIWREMRDFTPDAVLLVIASEEFDEADYIRDYGAFLRLAHRG